MLFVNGCLIQALWLVRKRICVPHRANTQYRSRSRVVVLDIWVIVPSDWSGLLVRHCFWLAILVWEIHPVP